MALHQPGMNAGPSLDSHTGESPKDSGLLRCRALSSLGDHFIPYDLSAEGELKSLTQPWDLNVRLLKARGQQQRVVGTPLKPDGYRSLVNFDSCGRVNKIAEQMS